MWHQFFLENVHFALSLFAALIFFAIGWLYFDAWTGKKTIKDGLKIAGLFVLVISFLLDGVSIESTILSSSFLDAKIVSLFLFITRGAGYGLLFAGLISDPLQPTPKAQSGRQTVSAGIPFATAQIKLSAFIPVIKPILGSAVGFLYLRRATVGLENHLKPVALAFYILSLYELVSLSSLLQNTGNVDLYKLVAPFGPVWIAKHIILFVALLLLGRWVYYYLLKRVQTQLFMIFTTSILLIFLITTVTFTGLLLRNLEQETLRQLETDVRVLQFAVESKMGETLSDAEVLANSPQVKDALTKQSKKDLAEIAESTLLAKKQNVLVIVNEKGQVMARGEDKEQIGDSLSDDPLIKRSLFGEKSSSVVSKDGVLAPEVSIRSATPIRQDNEIVGAVMTGTVIDNAFVDGVKKTTGLDASVYGDTIRSATTFVASDGKSRWTGIKEENTVIKQKVLREGKVYRGSVVLLNVPYFAAYSPLKDVDSNPVGMLFVGRESIKVLQAAGKSIELTFLMTVILLVVSVLPSYLIARYISYQLS